MWISQVQKHAFWSNYLSTIIGCFVTVAVHPMEPRHARLVDQDYPEPDREPTRIAGAGSCRRQAGRSPAGAGRRSRQLEHPAQPAVSAMANRPERQAADAQRDL